MFRNSSGANIGELLPPHFDLNESEKLLTVVFTLLYRAVLRSSLGNWVLSYELANYIAKYPT